MCPAAASSPGPESIRTAEVIAALSLATDLGIGVELEHGLQSTIVAMRLCDRLGADRETASQTFYATLLLHIGCTADAEVAAEIFGGDLSTHVIPALFGSTSEMLVALLRTLPDPDSPPLVRAVQAARRLPRAGRTNRAHLAALAPSSVRSAPGAAWSTWPGRARTAASG